MEPIKTNTIHNGNAIDVLKTFPDGCIDLTVVSFPYDDLRIYTGYDFDHEGIFDELFRVTKDGGVVVSVIADATVKGSLTLTSCEQALYAKKKGFSVHARLIYEKNGASAPSKVRCPSVTEDIYIFCKGNKPTFNAIKDKRNRWAGSNGFGNRKIRGRDGSLTEGSRKPVAEYSIRDNVWRYFTGAGYTSQVKDRALAEVLKKHPARMPDLLAFDLIRSFSRPGEIVLDCCAGSGTSLAMAQVLGRQFIGIEISPEYCDIIRQRLAYQYDVNKLIEEAAKQYNSRIPPRED